MNNFTQFLYDLGKGSLWFVTKVVPITVVILLLLGWLAYYTMGWWL